MRLSVRYSRFQGAKCYVPEADAIHQGLQKVGGCGLQMGVARMAELDLQASVRDRDTEIALPGTTIRRARLSSMNISTHCVPAHGLLQQIPIQIAYEPIDGCDEGVPPAVCRNAATPRTAGIRSSLLIKSVRFTNTVMTIANGQDEALLPRARLYCALLRAATQLVPLLPMERPRL